jgi:hypothetical protein
MEVNNKQNSLHVRAEHPKEVIVISSVATDSGHHIPNMCHRVCNTKC